MVPMPALLAAMILLSPGPTSAAAQPTSAPAQPTTAPAQPTSAAAQPTSAAAQPGAEPVDDPSGFESATVVSGLSMIVERPGQRLVAERDTTYTIAVNNTGEDPQTLTVRVTVPPWMPEVTPLDGGELGEGFVDWPVTVAPGQVTVMRLTGAYASPERDSPTRVAFTACALGAEDGQPIVCATDIGRLESAGTGVRWWLVATITAVAAAAGAGLFLLLRRRRATPTTPTA